MQQERNKHRKVTGWTAVVIANGHDRPVDGKSVPLHRVAGLSVLGRHIMAALHGGATRCRLVLPPGAEVAAEEARSYWTRSGGLDVVEVEENTSETDALRASVREEDKTVVVLFSDVSFSRNILQALLQEGLGDSDALVVVGEPECFGSDESFHRPIGSGYTRFAGIALLDAEAARKLPADMTLADAFNSVSDSFRMRLRPMENSFALRIESREDLEVAEKQQLRALRRNSDGLVSRWLNRPVSLFLSRHLFLRLPLTPNHITLIAGVIGWIAIAIMFLWPGYWWVLLGALLFHFSSILDGCDGEIARLRYQFSTFGEWFDNVLDEFNNAAFIAGIGIGIYRTGGHEVLAWAAGFYFLAIAVCDSAVFYQLARWHGGTGNFERFRWFFEPEEGPPPNPTAFPPKRKLSDLLKNLPRRDFYIFLLFVLAILDLMIVGFWIALGTGVALFFLGIAQWIWQIRSDSSKRR